MRDERMKGWENGSGEDEDGIRREREEEGREEAF
jgi:hypothetical protein